MALIKISSINTIYYTTFFLNINNSFGKIQIRRNLKKILKVRKKMYYHIVKQEGLKYKNLDLKEVEEVVKKEKLNFNNSRIYSSTEALEHTIERFKQNENSLEEVVDRNEIRITDIIPCKNKNEYLHNCSYNFFMKILNSNSQPRWKVFFNKTFIIWIMLLSTVLNRYLFYFLYKYYYKFSTYKLLLGFNIKPIWYVSLIYILIPLSFILLIWYRDKYYKKNYLLMFIVLMVVINQIVDYILGDTIDRLVVNFGGLLAIFIGLILTQLFYNLFRRLSYNKYKDF